MWWLTENVFYFSWTPSLLQTPSIIQIIVSRRPNFAFSLNLWAKCCSSSSIHHHGWLVLVHLTQRARRWAQFETYDKFHHCSISLCSFWFWVKTRTFFAETSQSPSGCLLHIWRNSLEMTLRLTDDPKTRRLCPQLSLLQTHKNKSVVLNSSFRVYLRLWFKCQRQKCVCVCSSLVFQVSSFCPAQLHLIFLTT